MEPNPLREIRDIRRQIAQESGDDAEKVFAYYLQHQERMKASGKYKFVTRPNQSSPAGIAVDQDDATAQK